MVLMAYRNRLWKCCAVLETGGCVQRSEIAGGYINDYGCPKRKVAGIDGTLMESGGTPPLQTAAEKWELRKLQRICSNDPAGVIIQEALVELHLHKILSNNHTYLAYPVLIKICQTWSRQHESATRIISFRRLTLQRANAPSMLRRRFHFSSDPKAPWSCIGWLAAV